MFVQIELSKTQSKELRALIQLVNDVMYPIQDIAPGPIMTRLSPFEIQRINRLTERVRQFQSISVVNPYSITAKFKDGQYVVSGKLKDPVTKRKVHLLTIPDEELDSIGTVIRFCYEYAELIVGILTPHINVLRDEYEKLQDSLVDDYGVVVKTKIKLKYTSMYWITLFIKCERVMLARYILEGVLAEHRLAPNGGHDN